MITLHWFTLLCIVSLSGSLGMVIAAVVAMSEQE